MSTVTTATGDFAVDTIEEDGDVVLTYTPEPGATAVVLGMPHEAWVAMGRPTSIAVTLETKCRVCGCTDSQGCWSICAWVAPGLCSECV